ncbi:PQQ-dependent sugar dehydrogenase [Salirhabdus sp. Marseille-P4669]|uniref:PQQ-dependent sugar dehydrogenase n=1 Tax=Salirhabdus sp. Marseille-P4669 TaxID=2042310 RepID=UPI000C7AF038|nr:PQQ-dependent sugar dehydrogenase [Salirhabdus sp. Marseille-P4669]
MKKYVSFILLCIIIGCSPKEDNALETTANDTVVLATNLNIPWTINKIENTFYLSERGGTIVKVDSETGDVARQQIRVSKDILHTGEGGLLGFLLKPDFESSREAFAYHTYQEEGQILNRVITLKLTNGEWVEEAVLLEGIPGGRIHNGGRLKIGPDNKLYVTAGDAGEAELAQDTNSLAGKILRLNVDGSIPSDNPFDNSYVYSYGHRNPQGLVWDGNGVMYSTEHGQSAHDEINKIEPGKNYGWPVIQGDKEKEGMIRPIFHTGEETWAPSGIAIEDRTMYIATLRGSKLIAFHLDDHQYDTLYNEGGRLRDVFVENGYVYIVTNNLDGRGTPQANDDKLIRLPILK